MSYGGYEYGDRSFGGGFDPVGGSFGGFGGDTGGGFMAEEKGAKSSEKKSRDRQTILPLTVKQVVEAHSTDDVYRVDNVELNIIKLIGTASAPSEHSTNFTFRLTDGSGSIEVKQWIDKNSTSNNKWREVHDGSMVRVIGNLREYEGKTHILAFDISLLSDWNELTYHTLDIVLTHLQNTKGPITGSAPAGGSGSFNTPNAFGRPGVAPMSVPSGPGMSLNRPGQHDTQSLNDVIYSGFVAGAHTPAGSSYQQVMEYLKARGINIAFDQLVRGVQQLCEDGRMYTTVDEEHYRPTD